MKKILFLTASLTVAPPVMASETGIPMNYDTFEAAVDHADLEHCPQDLPRSDTFCRVTLRNDELHVFAFSSEGDNQLVGFASYPIEALAGQLN